MAALCPLLRLPPKGLWRLVRCASLALTALAGSDLAAQPVPADSLADAIAGGRLSLELRPRYTDIRDAGLNCSTRITTSSAIATAGIVITVTCWVAATSSSV